MSRLEELLQTLCPNGIKKFKLSTISEIKRGQRITKSELIPEGPYPVISGGVNPMGFTNDFNRNEKTITVAQYGTAGFVNWQTNKFWANDVCYTIYPDKKLINRYLYYSLLSAQDFIYTLVIDAVPAHLPQKRLAAIEIFVPPLPVQEEIVRILDTFSGVVAELETEQAARVRQYEHYRNELLAFEKPATQSLTDRRVRWVTLGEIAVRSKGTPITAARMKELDKLNAPVKIFAGGKTVAFFDYTDLPEKDVNTYPSVVVKSRGVIEFEYCDKPFSHKNEMWSYHSERDDVDIKFLYYWLKTQEPKLRDKATSMGAFPQIAIPDTEKMAVPLPSLEEQNRVVEILDRFDTLVNDLKSGLPAEIALRRKQYEYYRDKLLTFKPKPTD